MVKFRPRTQRKKTFSVSWLVVVVIVILIGMFVLDLKYI
ncbi:hypothetical protein FORMA_01110 [Formosa sp. Hel3_A1_48]|nr:hypothetical protein FORMA_01110 [Formosa sp. Hel3_A1_48]